MSRYIESSLSDPVNRGKKRTNGIVVEVGSLKVFRDIFEERENTKRYQCVSKDKFM